MTYLCGSSVHYGVPSDETFDFLGVLQTAKYYRAFGAERLDIPQTAVVCMAQIRAVVQEAGWPSEKLHEVPLFIGSTSYTVADSERPDFYGEPSYLLNDLAECLRRAGGFAAVHSFATSCTSAANALMQAHRLLESGLAERVLVLGVESFNLLTLMHFHSLGLLGSEYRPFRAAGLILGEGAACLALSRTRPSADGSIWRLAGIAAHTDTAQPAESSSGAMATVMQTALARADVAPHQIAEVKAHAVGSAGSDAAERQALSVVFGREPPLACIKPQTGHTLGASAAVETALWQREAEGRLKTGKTDFGGTENRQANHYLLANFFGFGGNLVSAVWEVSE